MNDTTQNTTATPHMNQLREHLLQTLVDLRNKQNPMEPDRARAVAQVAGVLVDTAKVEIDYIKATGAASSDFLEAEDSRMRLGSTPTASHPFPVSARHRLGD